MLDFKRKNLKIGEKELTNITNMKTGSCRDISITDDKNYNYTIRFVKEINYFSMRIFISNKLNLTQADTKFEGATDILEFFDKVFEVNFQYEKNKILIKISIGESTQDFFFNSIILSRNIDNLGNINLYKHILYSDFLNNKELIELCFKYVCYSNKFKESKEIKGTLLLDEDLYVIENCFQNKLEYYGYSSKLEINKFNYIDIKSIILKEAKTKQEFINKIVLLTQCLFKTGKYRDSVEDIILNISSLVDRYGFNYAKKTP